MFQKYSQDTSKYVRKYKEDFPEGVKGGWNDSVDAFRHAYMQAHSRYFYGIIKSKGGAWLHEIYGNTHHNQSKEENFMDNWNNNQGQEIALEVKAELKNMNKSLSTEDVEDYIAYKVIQKMRDGKIIRNIDEARKQINKNQKPTEYKTSGLNKSATNNFQKIQSEPPKTKSQNFSDMIRQKYKTQQAENNKKFSKIFRTSTPNSGNGHWVTMNGAHVFIED